ncbi:NADase-type glycan-binding domain-containing protein [Streptomyces sp. N50]|uniref:NADase-type glycan-binding domain-containing protein n=1 Tax=Streptomyces sp. N50 TaxID=3081765 RepID=UPI0029625BB9|nr:zinc ribbon domain-containing protein [Streptomyces sp. N50]WOX13306.1 zinc ribbon domain-containing protein [Streptomyces sp. N50]
MTTTQSCAECGTRAEPGQSFCDACGAVLSWTDRAGARTGAPAERGEGAAGEPGWDAFPQSDSAGPPRPRRDTLGTNEQSGQGSSGSDDPAARLDALSLRLDALAAGGSYDSVGAGSRQEPASGEASGGSTTPHVSGAATTHPTTDPAPAPDAPYANHDGGTARTPSTTDTAPTQPVPATSPEPGPEPESEAERARRLLVPVSDPEPRQAPSVAPVLPGRPVAARPQSVRAPGVEPGAAGGIPCPWCATANRPDRHYCARCAMPMAGEERAPGRLPWWRRLLAFRNGEIPWAGDRPRLRRTFDRVLTWVGAAVVLTLLIVLAVNIPRAVDATKDHFAKRAPVYPDRVSASRSFPGHKPELAFDRLNNTWWGPGVSQAGQGQWLEAQFDEPTRLLDLMITPGVSTRPDQIGQSALPHRIEAVITTAKGKTITRQITLDQGAGAQRRSFRVGTVTSVRFTVESAYGASGSKQVAIAEIEFFGPSNSGSS